MGSATAGTEDAPLIADRGKPPRSSRAVVALALGALAVVGGAGAAAIARVGAAAPAPLGERAANPAARWARAPRTRTSGSPLARLRPGEDLWDMIDRGLTETRRESRGDRDFDPDLDDARVAARRDEEKIRARLGVARLSHLGAHSDDEETADDFGRRVSNQERREAKEAFEEWKLENDVDGEFAGDPSKSSRAQIRKEERVAARRDEHADDRARRVAERRRVRREDRVEEKGFARRKDRFSKLRDEREAAGASAAAALSEADDEVDAETAVLQSVDAGLLEGDAAESAAAAEDAAADFIAAAEAADAADEKAADEKADSLPAAERREARVTARQERATAEEIAALEARVAADEDENDADEEAKDTEALRRAEASRKKRDAKERASSVADAARIEAQQEATEDALAAAIDGASVDDADSEESDVSALAGLQKRLRVVKRQKERAIEEAQQEAADDEADDEDSGSESYMGAFGRLGEEKGDEEEAAAPEPQPHGMYEFVEVPVNAHELEEGLQKMKEAREKYDGDAQMDEEAFEVAVSTAKSREREYAEAAAENYAEAHGLSSEEKIEKLEAERIDIERKQERTRAEINAQREELARGMREMGVTQLPDVAEAETQQLEEDTAEAEKLEEEDDEESEGEGDSYAAAALGSARTDAAEEDDEDSLPTNSLQLGWEIDELEKTKEKVLPRSSRGALGEEEVDEEAFEVAVDTAKSRVREYTEAAAEAYAEANGLSSLSEESIEDLEAEAAELDAEHERIDAEIAEEKKDLVEHLHDEGVWEEPEPGRAETEKLEEETHEKEQALKERIAEEHAHWHPWDEVEVFEKAWDGETGEEEATSDLGLDAAEEDDEDSLPTNPLQLGWEIDELEKTKEKVLPRSSRGALDFGTGPLSALEDILGASLDASDPETARPGRAARTTPRREHAPARRAAARAHAARPAAAAAAAVAASVPKESRFDEFRNAPGAIPGLLEHVLAHTASKAQLRASSNLGTEVGGSLASDLRLVTYANAAYWPLAKVMISSLAHNAPRALPSLTVMLTDPRDIAECDALSTRHGHSCFFDSDMIDTVLHGDASLANAEGSQLAGSDSLSAEPSLGKALRVAWCWRKVHALYTLVEGGVPAVFLDASTAVLADPRPAVAARLADGATLVTLSDFGGAKEQEAINTGLVAARAGDGRAARLLEEWMAMEPRAEDTEQAYLTWELAPEARARGDRIVALPHAKFPSYVTFDKREHIRGSGSRGEGRRESGDERGSKPDAPDAALGGERRDELELADGAGGIAVHAAYCGSVESKLAFLRRVDAMRRAPGKLHPVDPAETAPGGCDAYDRRKFFQCGHAPWDGDC